MIDTNSSVVKVKDLTKSYGATQAVKGISFAVGKGQVVGFLGPNGAGKSTTLKILTGYLKPSSGSISLFGIDVKKHGLEAKRQIGYLPENNPLYEEMMVMEYLEFVAQMRKIPWSKRKSMIDKAVHVCKLESVIGKDIGSLSKGYCQRVGLAQAIVHDPQLLILDEPTSGLDPNQIIEIRSLIKDLGLEKTVLMSTHILSEAESTCSRILIINEGRLVADDTPMQLTMQEGGELFVVVKNKPDGVVSQTEVLDLFSGISGVDDVQNVGGSTETGFSVLVSYNHGDPRVDLFNAVVQKNWIMLEMSRKELTLEETFRRLTLEKK